MNRQNNRSASLLGLFLMLFFGGGFSELFSSQNNPDPTTDGKAYYHFNKGERIAEGFPGISVYSGFNDKMIEEKIKADFRRIMMNRPPMDDVCVIEWPQNPNDISSTFSYAPFKLPLDSKRFIKGKRIIMPNYSGDSIEKVFNLIGVTNEVMRIEYPDCEYVVINLPTQQKVGAKEPAKKKEIFDTFLELIIKRAKQPFKNHKAIAFINIFLPKDRTLQSVLDLLKQLDQPQQQINQSPQQQSQLSASPAKIAAVQATVSWWQSFKNSLWYYLTFQWWK